MARAVVTQGRTEPFEPAGLWSEASSAAVASVVAGLLTAFPAFLVDRMGYIAWLFTLGATNSPLVGLGFHVLCCAIFGAFWAAVGGLGSAQRYVLTPTTGMAAGMFYGVALWFVNVGFLTPLFGIHVLGDTSVSLPYLLEFDSLVVLIGHMMWGGILGLGYPLVRDRMLQ